MRLVKLLLVLFVCAGPAVAGPFEDGKAAYYNRIDPAVLEDRNFCVARRQDAESLFLEVVAHRGSKQPFVIHNEQR